MDRAHGLDISFWNGIINFDTMMSRTDFLFVKASQLRADPKFAHNWSEARKRGMLRGAYHYLDWRTSELTQAALFTSLLRDDPGELPPVVDYEMRTGAPPRAIAQGRLWNFVSAVEKAIGRKPIIYTGYYYWNEFGSVAPGWADFPLWEAWYRVPEWYMRVPRPWSKWTFWQYNDKGLGKYYGTESLQVDVNWFNGTVEDLKAFAGNVPTPPPPDTDDMGQYVFNGSNLWVFASPDSSSKIVSALKNGQTVTVLQTVINLGEEWAQLESPAGWCRFAYLSKP